MTKSEPASLSVEPETIFLELTFERALRIWWAYFWRHMLYGGGMILVVEALERLAGLGGRHLLVQLSAVLVMAAASLVVLGIVLHKQFRDFSIRIVATPRRSTTG